MVADLEFLCDEPLRDLVLDDGGDARLDVVEDVACVVEELAAGRRTQSRASRRGSAAAPPLKSHSQLMKYCTHTAT